jgi:hypothetical protein
MQILWAALRPAVDAVVVLVATLLEGVATVSAEATAGLRGQAL